MPNLIIQARTVLSNILWQPPVTGTEMIQFVDQLQYVLDCACIRIWSKIFAMIALHGMAVQESRKCLLHRHTNIRIPFVIRHHRIILRAVFLDQITFKHKRFHLRSGDNILKIRNLRHHTRNLRRSAMSMSGLKILPYTVVETDCLAHVENIIIFAMHDIHTRALRKLPQLFFHIENLGTFFRIPACPINIYIYSMSIFCHISPEKTRRHP